MFEEEKKTNSDKCMPTFPGIDLPPHLEEVIKKFITLCVPVQVTPKVKIGKVKTERCGEPIITAKPHGICNERKCEDGCHFHIVQKMKLEIPVEFDATTKVEESFVDCEIREEFGDYRPEDVH